MTTRQQLEDDVRRYFAERGLFLELYPFYLPQKRTLVQLPLWLDYWLEGRAPPLPGELEVTSVEWCPRCQYSGEPLLRGSNWTWLEGMCKPTPEPTCNLCGINANCGDDEERCARPRVRRWGLRRRKPKLRNRPSDYGPVRWEDVHWEDLDILRHPREVHLADVQEEPAS